MCCNLLSSLYNNMESVSTLLNSITPTKKFVRTSKSRIKLKIILVNGKTTAKCKYRGSD